MTVVRAVRMVGASPRTRNVARTSCVTTLGFGLAAATILASLVSPAETRAQQQTDAQTQARAASQLMTYFYKDPRPEKLDQILRSFPKTASQTSWRSYPPLVGFLAVALPKYPDGLDRIPPDQIDAQMGEAFAAAARLSGDATLGARVQQKIKSTPPDPKLRAAFADLPARITELQVTVPTHLDILWGAAFASGDERYVRRIVDFVASTSNRSPPVALDVARIALAMSGGPKDVYPELRSRYGDRELRALVFAATGLWALGSNARQHPFVRRTLEAEVAARAGTPAGNALKVFLPKP